MAHSSLRRLWLAVGSIPDGRLRLLKCSLRRLRLNKVETVGSGSEFLSSVEDEVGPFLVKWTTIRSDFRTYLTPSTGSNLSVRRESISPPFVDSGLWDARCACAANLWLGLSLVQKGRNLALQKRRLSNLRVSHE